MYVLIWLFHPSKQGATLIYHKYLRGLSKPVIKAFDDVHKERMKKKIDILSEVF